MPTRTATGKVYDSGDFTATYESARWKVGNWNANFQARQAGEEGRHGARHRPCCYVECLRHLGEETANVTLDPNGGHLPVSGPSRAGRGHQTGIRANSSPSSSVCDERVHVLQGDTDKARHRSLHRRLGVDPRTAASASSARQGVTRRQAHGDRGRGAGWDQPGDIEISNGVVRIDRNRPLDKLRRPRKTPGRDPSKTECECNLSSRHRRHLPERHASRRSPRSTPQPDIKISTMSSSTISA